MVFVKDDVKIFIGLIIPMLLFQPNGFSESSQEDRVVRRNVALLSTKIDNMEKDLAAIKEAIAELLVGQKELKEKMQEEHKQIRYFTRRH